MKAGKLASAAVGSSILLLLVASQKGYINVNWSRVNRDLENAKSAVEGKASTSKVSNFINQVQILTF